MSIYSINSPSTPLHFSFTAALFLILHVCIKNLLQKNVCWCEIQFRIHPLQHTSEQEPDILLRNSGWVNFSSPDTTQQFCTSKIFFEWVIRFQNFNYWSAIQFRVPLSTKSYREQCKTLVHTPKVCRLFYCTFNSLNYQNQGGLT